MNEGNILIVDDKPNIREVFSNILKEEGYEVNSCESSEKAIKLIEDIFPDVVITDIKMPGMDGIELMKKIKDININIPVILITAYGSISSAVESIKEGAYDYLTKPVDYDRLKILVKRAINEKKITCENLYLKQELEKKYILNNIIGSSNLMKKVLNLAKTVAVSDSNILILGECGTGKELIAKAIHFNSLRKKGQFVIVDCSALPDELLESELFGYEKGAFTGASCRKKGRIELAESGTLFLDEIGEMSLRLQAKLLRVLQEKSFIRVGGLSSVKINFRLIAATNKNLEKEIENNIFRSDLYYRLNVITIKLPPLRDKKEDIPILIDHFIKKYCKREKVKTKIISPELFDCLMQYSWPGNVRELENCIERLIVICKDDIISKEYLSDEIIKCKNDNIFETIDKNYTLNEIEKLAVENALKATNWNKAKAAKLLNVDRKVLYNRIKKYSIVEIK